MILVDTSVWVDHLRHGDEQLANLLASGLVFAHPFVIGEIALGNLKQRKRVLDNLEALPFAPVASHDEAMYLMQSFTLHGAGIGYVDLHLLAAVKLEPGSKLWTRDAKLAGISRRLGLGAMLH